MVLQWRRTSLIIITRKKYPSWSPKMADAVVLPGERLGSVDEYEPASGTYIRGKFIYSKLVGRKRIKEETSGGGSKAKIYVQLGDESKHFVPEIGKMQSRFNDSNCIACSVSSKKELCA